MDRTNANDFRTNLKDWMDAAKLGPVKITRKSGESFILLNSDEFGKMQLEIANLRGIAQGLSEVIQGRVRKSTVDNTGEAVMRAKERVLGKKSKKATG